VALAVAGCGATAPVRADTSGHAAVRPVDPPPVAAPAAARPATRGVVLLVRTPRHLEAALATADTMRATDAAVGTTRPFHVIACGNAIDSVLRDAAAEPHVRAAVERGVVVARDRARLERLCRYVCRPPIVQDRLEEPRGGKLR
jgi:hypothetical protein